MISESKKNRVIKMLDLKYTVDQIVNQVNITREHVDQILQDMEPDDKAVGVHFGTKTEKYFEKESDSLFFTPTVFDLSKAELEIFFKSTDYYSHHKKGGKYKVIHKNMSIQVEDKWLKALAYISLEEGVDQIFVRSYEDFEKSFTKLE